jgi:hypothetical protein
MDDCCAWLGEQDLVLSLGEPAGFDTRTHRPGKLARIGDAEERDWCR